MKVDNLLTLAQILGISILGLTLMYLTNLIGMVLIGV